MSSFNFTSLKVILVSNHSIDIMNCLLIKKNLSDTAMNGTSSPKKSKNQHDFQEKSVLIDPTDVLVDLPTKPVTVATINNNCIRKEHVVARSCKLILTIFLAFATLWIMEKSIFLFGMVTLINGFQSMY
jgi:hypothetical protein